MEDYEYEPSGPSDWDSGKGQTGNFRFYLVVFGVLVGVLVVVGLVRSLFMK